MRHFLTFGYSLPYSGLSESNLSQVGLLAALHDGDAVTKS